MKGTALIVEDEPQIAQILCDYLEKDGFCTAVLSDGDHVVPFVRKTPPDIILLDVMLPRKDGVEICGEIRAFSEIPIIFITARVEEIDRLLGLRMGADDYICKPFSPREVVARVNAILRRVRAMGKGDTLSAGPVTIDKKTRMVTVAGTPVELTPYEYDLLGILMDHPGRVYNRGELVAKVQGYSFEGYERVIDSHIKNLRKKLGAALPGRTLIQTVYGVGYRFDD